MIEEAEVFEVSHCFFSPPLGSSSSEDALLFIYHTILAKSRILIEGKSSVIGIS